MQVSIIIPTYNRVKDLDECLDSIIVQTTLPKEVIIVDDSDNDEIGNLITHRRNEFKEKDILLRYVRNERERSLAIARNIGVENATGDIILYLDSDVVLDKDYIKEILKVYKEKPDTLGVQGLIQSKRDDRVIVKFADAFKKVFYIYSKEKNRCRVSPSFGVTYPSFCDEIIECEWLSGANHSYRKQILQDFKFDEKLKKYSYDEDTDISYRIFKKYPGSLFMTPHAKLIHKASEEGRHLRKEVIYINTVYQTYLFYKNIDQNLKNKLIFLWNRIGHLIVNIGDLILGHSKEKFLKLKYIIDAYIICMTHIKEIKKGDLEFFNKELR